MKALLIGMAVVAGFLLSLCVMVAVVDWIDTHWLWQARYDAWQVRHPILFTGLMLVNVASWCYIIGSWWTEAK